MKWTITAATVSLSVLIGSVGFAAKGHNKPMKKAPRKPPAKAAMGDVKGGKLLFAKKFPAECKACHKFGKTGGTIGSDLTHAGKKMSAAKIKQVLKVPGSVFPNTAMPPTQGTDKQLTDIAAYLATLK